MVGTATVSGGATHGMATLSQAELQAAQGALAKLANTQATIAPHLGRSLESATVSSGSLHSFTKSSAALGESTLLSARGSDTFIGGVRGGPPTAALSIGSDTVVSGSTAKLSLGAIPHTVTGRGVEHFSLSSDTINVAGTTAASIHSVPHQGGAIEHTVTLSDKTTIKIAGLSSHDISKLHH